MAIGNPLCHACQSIFSPDLTRFRKGLLKHRSKWPLLQHHKSMDDFFKAAEENCWICMRNWKYTVDKSRMFPDLLSSNDVTNFGMRYHLFYWGSARDDDTRPPFRLLMEWHFNGIRFDKDYCLLPHDGECRCVHTSLPVSLYPSVYRASMQRKTDYDLRSLVITTSRNHRS